MQSAKCGVRFYKSIAVCFLTFNVWIVEKMWLFRRKQCLLKYNIFFIVLACLKINSVYKNNLKNKQLDIIIFKNCITFDRSLINPMNGVDHNSVRIQKLNECLRHILLARFYSKEVNKHSRRPHCIIVLPHTKTFFISFLILYPHYIPF